MISRGAAGQVFQRIERGITTPEPVHRAKA